MMWLAVDSVRSEPKEPQLYSTELVIPETDKVIKIGNSEFKGSLQNGDYLVVADDTKFDHAGDWTKKVMEARHVKEDEIRKAKQAGYARGVEDQKNSDEKKIFLRDFLKLYDGTPGVYCSLYLYKGNDPEFIGTVPIKGEITKKYKNYIVKRWFLYGADADLNIYLEDTYEDD